MSKELNPLTYWSSFIAGLKTKGVDEALSALYIRNEPLNRLIRHELSHHATANSLLSDPVFEGMFAWKRDSKSIEELGLFHSKTLDSFDQKEAPYFKKNWQPYQHQVEAFKLLLNETKRKSLIVSSGTGSGKTECFLMPMIEDLVREREARGSKYKNGVRALFLYPLNALIDSQLERLTNWTKDFEGDIRFCRYNGVTPQSLPADDVLRIVHPEQVFDRKTLREKPADMLLTNPSMLELMLVRQEDQPIIEKTRNAKCFRWIVIDEAHTYLGSRAANLALLLRRVLVAFDVKPEEVHFVATSATIDASDEVACQKLKKFLQDISGTTEDRVHLVLGKRDLPRKIQVTEDNALTASELLEQAKRNNAATLLEQLKQNQTAMSLRNYFIDKGFARLSALKKHSGLVTDEEALTWLDLLTTPMKSSGEPFLPLRMHLMLNSGATLKACANPCCPHKQEELNHKDWHFGSVWFDGRSQCDCGAPLFPIVVCSRCNGVSLKGLVHFDEATFSDSIVPIVDDRESEAIWMQAQLNGQEDIMTLPEGIVDSDSENRSDHLGNDKEFEVNEGSLDDAPVTHIAGFTFPVLLCPAVDGSLESKVQWTDAEGQVQSFSVHYFKQGQNEEGKISCHECGQELQPKFFFQRSLSQRYLNHLLPYILEYCSTDQPNKEADLPFSGRRLISFTDSRQGTARTSALLEREGERSLVAKFLYSSLSMGLKPEEQKTLASYKKALDTTSDPIMLSLLNTEIKKLESKSKRSWPDLLKDLTESLCTSENTPKPHRALVRAMWGHTNISDAQRQDTAQILLLREFISRPINGMSLETCGLFSVQYQGLETLDAPEQWLDRGKTNEQWQAFLKLVLDFFVRQNHCVNLPNAWRRIGGNRRIFGKTIVPVGQTTTKTQVGWPQIRTKGRPQRIVRWLGAFLNIDITTCAQNSEDWMLINQLFNRAFDQLRYINILKLSDQLAEKVGYVLNLDTVCIVKNNFAWLFEGQNKLFDTIVGQPEMALCPLDESLKGAKKINIPEVKFSRQEWNERPDFAWNDNPKQLREEVRNFMHRNPEMRFLIENGIWNRLGTYAYEQTGYFAAGEHTAQVEKIDKDMHVENFRKGLLNILACSTTMEMGVDLASINSVVMTNVPPHPANYMQRAGRAGRRQESRANTLTLCHSSPRDREIFANPDWALTGKQPTLHVTFNSEKIVRQHLQAQLLSYFFAHKYDSSDNRKMTLEVWIKGPCQLFINWCTELSEKKMLLPNDLLLALQLISRNTVLEGRPILDCLTQAAETMTVHLEQWKETLLRYNTQLREATEEIVKRAFEHHLNRFKDELLYTTLTSNSYLPSTVTILNASTFNNLTTEEESRLVKGDYKGSKIVKLPTRDSHIAIYEYAPGASILINNKVFTSHGLTLNWKIPAAESNIVEVQSIKRFVECRSCHHKFLLTPDLEAKDDAICPECQSTIHLNSSQIHEAIIPAGYSVDEVDTPHNDYSSLVMYGYSDTIATVDDVWKEINALRLGFRSSSNGHLLSYNKGLGYGYDLCLCCGWARAITMEDTENPELTSYRHYPLRRTLASNTVSGGYCKGGEADGAFRMKHGLYLVAESNTDCMEFAFENCDKAQLETNEYESIGLGLGVVIRRAICKRLGVDEDEIGIAFRYAKLKRGFIISLYDHNNSGYCSSIGEDEVIKLLTEAKQYLHCPNKCSTACTSCLITFDTHRRASELDRHKCLKLLQFAMDEAEPMWF